MTENEIVLKKIKEYLKAKREKSIFNTNQYIEHLLYLISGWESEVSNDTDK